MSGIPPDADIERWTYDVRFVPTGDIPHFRVVPQFGIWYVEILRGKLCLLRSNWSIFRWLALDAVAVLSRSRFQKSHPR
jgi:hypothetical protein